VTVQKRSAGIGCVLLVSLGSGDVLLVNKPYAHVDLGQLVEVITPPTDIISRSYVRTRQDLDRPIGYSEKCLLLKNWSLSWGRDPSKFRSAK
jgi:hypothetical protein